jgi:hypothetical protein
VLLVHLLLTRGACKVSAASGGSTTAPGSSSRVRRSVQNSRVKQDTATQHNSSSNGTQSRPTNSTSSALSSQQRVRRPAPRPVVTPDQGTTGFATAGNNNGSSSSQVLDARKNPELYSHTQERVEFTHHHQHQQQQQQQQQQQRQTSAPLPSPSGQGSVGSTGAYSSEPEPHIQQQRQRGSSSSRPPLLRHKPEVLSPAGGWPQLRAAVENGADAVYFGVTGFNARAR